MGHPVVHFQIGAKDAAAAAEFYSQLFGWSATPVPDMPYHMLQTGSALGIQGGIGAAANDAEAVVTFYVEVPDVGAALARAVELGGTVIQPAVEVMPTLTLGMFTDLEGRAVGLSRDTTPRPVAAPVKRKVERAKKSPKKPKGKKDKKDKKGAGKAKSKGRKK